MGSHSKAGFREGLQLFLSSYRYIRDKKLLLYTIAPLCSAAALASLLVYGVFFSVDSLGNLLAVSDYIGSLATGILQTILSAVIGIFAYFYVFPLLVSIVFQLPIIGLGSFSEKIEEVETNRTYDFPLRTEIELTVIGLIATVQDFVTKTVLVLAAGWLPVIGQILLFLNPVDWYFEGKGWMDLTAERHMKSLRQRKAFFASHRRLITSIGMCYKLTYLLPVVGLFIGPLFAACASTRAFLLVNQEN